MKLEELNVEQFKSLLNNHIGMINQSIRNKDVYDIVIAYCNAANDGVIGYLPIHYHHRWTTMNNDRAVVLIDGQWKIGNLQDIL